MSNTKNKQANKHSPQKANSIFFPLILNQQTVIYSCFFCELLQDALDFNDFGEGGGRDHYSSKLSLSITGECLAAFLCCNICLPF